MERVQAKRACFECFQSSRKSARCDEAVSSPQRKEKGALSPAKAAAPSEWEPIKEKMQRNSNKIASHSGRGVDAVDGEGNLKKSLPTEGEVDRVSETERG